MNFKPILVIPGEKKSIFFEIFFKTIKSKNYKSPIILICSSKIFQREKKKYNYKNNIETLNLNEVKKKRKLNDKIYIIDIKNHNSKFYVEKCFKTSFFLIRNGFTNKIINGPVNKKKTLKKKYLGITEYFSENFKQKKYAMLIYNKNLSVCPITTHLPIKLVTKNISKKLIKEKILIINNFYKKYLGFKPRIGVVGLNPHCESILRFNEDDKIILPIIESLKSKVNVKGPYSADTIFLRNNRKNFDVIVGMYHDQVLGPMKTLYEFNAINITIGLPFLRITPDHGPNEKMIGKNVSNPISLINAFDFLDKK